MKHPWMPVYVPEWLLSGTVRAMSPEARAVYFDLILYSWMEDGIDPGLIEQKRTLAQLCGVSSRKFEQLWTQVRASFEQDSSGFWRCKRVEIERLKADKFSEKQSNVAKLRHAKHATAVPGTPHVAMPLTVHNNTIQSTKNTDTVSPVGGQAAFDLQPDKPKKPGPAKVDRGDVAALIDAYRQLWVHTRKPKDGKPPTMTAADSGQAVRLIREHGLIAATKYLAQYLADPSQWLCDAGHPLRHMTSKVNSYRATVTPLRSAQVGYAPASSGHNAESRDVTDEF